MHSICSRNHSDGQKLELGVWTAKKCMAEGDQRLQRVEPRGALRMTSERIVHTECTAVVERGQPGITPRSRRTKRLAGGLGLRFLEQSVTQESGYRSVLDYELRRIDSQAAGELDQHLPVIRLQWYPRGRAGLQGP